LAKVQQNRQKFSTNNRKCWQ